MAREFCSVFLGGVMETFLGLMQLFIDACIALMEWSEEDE